MTDQSQPVNQDGGNDGGSASLLHPVVFIALLILFSVFVLIGAAILGWDSGVLKGMAEARFARGLITYLFAVVTMGTAILLIVSALTSSSTEAEKEKFQRGKEVLSLLLGVFGTIVGFYFGSELAETPQRVADLQLSPPLLDASQMASGQSTAIRAYASGGTPPYRYGVASGEGAQVEYTKWVEANGWIVTEFVAPEVRGEQTIVLQVGVRDSAGRALVTDRELTVTGPAEQN